MMRCFSSVRRVLESEYECLRESESEIVAILVSVLSVSDLC